MIAFIADEAGDVEHRYLQADNVKHFERALTAARRQHDQHFDLVTINQLLRIPYYMMRNGHSTKFYQ